MNDLEKEYCDNYLKEIFKEYPVLLKRLMDLHTKKQEIQDLKSRYGNLSHPIIITVSGTPRSGKTTCIDNLFEFFKKCDLKTVCVEEPAGLIYQTLKTKDDKKKILSDRIGFVEKQWKIGCNHINKSLDGNDIIICDRGIIDTFIWYDMYYKLGMMNEKRYNDYFKRLEILNEDYNYFYALSATSDEAIKRDYVNSLSIEPRSTMNKENIERYNQSLIDCLPIIESNIDYLQFIDTTNCDRMEASIIVADDVSNKIKKLYLER